MPQRDDKIQIYIRIPQETWDQLGAEPSVVLEGAVDRLRRAIARGRKINFPPDLVAGEGVVKRIWLTPPSAALVKETAAANKIKPTPIIRAALELYWSETSDRT